jgi:DNA-directed RNA polymerase subunit RPC12/RpoP
MTASVTIECGRCNTPLVGPTNPKPNDMFACPRCGGKINYKDASKQAGKLVRSMVAKELKDTFRKAGFR